ncbi:MAG: L,D-transpeptidase family protein [Chitinophagaceae bacterium]
MVKNFIILFLFFGNVLFAQNSFVQDQRLYVRVDNAFKQREDSLKKQFKKQELQWPPKQMYLRSFKYDSQLEVWIKNNGSDTFSFFKTYKVCALSGAMGPKRIEGDYQVPEGFYHINAFNPKSMYHLALSVNYPNASDAILSDTINPGGEIFIHGGCITVGCIPIKDNQIEELYVLSSIVKNEGQDFIPVHIFPVQYNNKKSLTYLAMQIKDNKEYLKFVENIQQVYDYFNLYKKLPVIGVSSLGEYVLLK